MAYKEVEAAIDIALMAGALIAADCIEVEDSRELVRFIAQQTGEFERSGYDTEDYIGEVDRFAMRVLKEKYGPTNP